MDSDNGQGTITLADFDLDQWIDGTTGISGIARLIQRGDLLAERDRLEAKLQTEQRIADEHRAVGDPTPEAIQAQLDEVYRQLWDSMLLLHVQDRTVDRRNKIEERLKAQGLSDRDIGLHLLADAIVKVETPDGRVVPLPEGGFPPAKLQAVRDRLGDTGLLDLMRVFREVTAKAPAVRAPLSRGSSSTPAGTT